MAYASSSSAIGAKHNWDEGVYEDGHLKPGKEQWCLGCHDDIGDRDKLFDGGDLTTGVGGGTNFRAMTGFIDNRFRGGERECLTRFVFPKG